MSAVPELCHNPPSLGIVVAMTRQGVIGRENRLPWDLPEDRRLFRHLTEGNTVVMGRVTFEGLAAPLANRHNIILSHSLGDVPGATVCRSFLEGLAKGWQLARPVYVIGGVALYRKALAIADTLHISWVEGDYPGDRFFPTLDFAAWETTGTTDFPGFRYTSYRRRPPR